MNVCVDDKSRQSLSVCLCPQNGFLAVVLSSCCRADNRLGNVSCSSGTRTRRGPMWTDVVDSLLSSFLFSLCFRAAFAAADLGSDNEDHVWLFISFFSLWELTESAAYRGPERERETEDTTSLLHIDVYICLCMCICTCIYVVYDNHSCDHWCGIRLQDGGKNTTRPKVCGHWGWPWRETDELLHVCPWTIIWSVINVIRFD